MEAACECCGKPATCLGHESDELSAYACDDCCGHSNEAGRCTRLDAESIQRRVNELETWNARLRESAAEADVDTEAAEQRDIALDAMMPALPFDPP